MYIRLTGLKTVECIHRNTQTRKQNSAKRKHENENKKKDHKMFWQSEMLWKWISKEWNKLLDKKYGKTNYIVNIIVILKDELDKRM